MKMPTQKQIHLCNKHNSVHPFTNFLFGDKAGGLFFTVTNT